MQVIRDGKEYWVADGHEWFWPGFASGAWEPSTFRIFDKFLDKEKTFVDIGAWIGPTVLYAAPKAKQVYAFEPDPVAYKSLVQNLHLNKVGNVVPYPVAVAERWKGLDFGVKTALGDSMSSVLWATGGDRQVPAVGFEAIVLDLMPSFIKIDIEGGEKTIFDGAALAMDEIKPTIHLSLHTPWFKDSLEEFKKSVMEGLRMFPFFYDENFNRIELKDVFNVDAFNSVICTYKEIV